VTEPLFNRIAIVGIGLLGGSLGIALRARKLCNEITGVVRNDQTLVEAQRIEAIDHGTLEARGAIAQADLVVLCTPVSHIVEKLPELISAARPGTIFTDVGSTKSNIVRIGEQAASLNGCHFVGSHPMAGSEKSGVRHARESLYSDSTCFVTKSGATDMSAFIKVCKLWSGIGARVVVCRPERHDRLVAAVSHLPHILSVALVRAVSGFGEDKNLIKGIIGNGFRDMTRIAEGNSKMWQDIFTDNCPELSRARTEFDAALQELMAACGPAGSPESLGPLLEEASEYREFLSNR
jgi:prephenate dehydrogenase